MAYRKTRGRTRNECRWVRDEFFETPRPIVLSCCATEASSDQVALNHVDIFTGRPAAGSSGLPAGDGVVQESEFDRVEVAGPVGGALGVDPHPEGMFAFRGVVVVPRPIVAFGPVAHELGETVAPKHAALGVVATPVFPPAGSFLR